MFRYGFYGTNKQTVAPLGAGTACREEFLLQQKGEAAWTVSEEVPLHGRRLQLAPQTDEFGPLFARQRASGIAPNSHVRFLTGEQGPDRKH